jgi:ankyrin repeat protein
MTPLLFAAYHGRVAFVNLLLNRREVDIQQSNVGKLNGLHLAAWKGHAAVLSQLISAKADVTALDANSASPLHYAAQYGHSKCISVLRTSSRCKISPNLANRILATPLHLAVGAGHLSAVKALFEFKELDPGLTNASHQTPFQVATARKLTDIIVFLRGQKSLALESKLSADRLVKVEEAD